ncbi:MAG: hypothetical protein AB7I27_11785 [Bacteriovoracaceae bacterium]
MKSILIFLAFLTFNAWSSSREDILEIIKGLNQALPAGIYEGEAFKKTSTGSIVPWEQMTCLVKVKYKDQLPGGFNFKSYDIEAYIYKTGHRVEMAWAIFRVDEDLIHYNVQSNMIKKYPSLNLEIESTEANYQLSLTPKLFHLKSEFNRRSNEVYCGSLKLKL